MKPTFRPLAAAPILAGLVSMAAASAAVAQTPAAATPAGTTPTADNKQDAVEDLIRLLVLRKSITQEEADTLLAKLHAGQPAAPAAAQAPTTTASPQPDTPAPADKGKVRVMYIPESEKQKIRNEIKEDVMQQAQAENWAQPSALPAWVKRISLDGDFRFRQEFDFYDGKNDPNQINFQAINSGAPFDENSTSTSSLSYLDATQDRELPRFRARLGLNAAIADDLSFGMRLASGNTTNPVSTNQTLGTDFNKTTFTIDRAYLEYRPLDSFTAWLGRMPNPWQSTELVWDDDLNFDGVAGRYVYSLTPFVKPSLTFGAFSVENTALDFPSTSADKVASRDKWLFGAQLGLDWKFNRNFKTRSAIAFYDFYHIEGAVSSPCDASTTSSSCDTDDSRPAFIQKGNTLMDLRSYPNATNPTGPLYEYYGLATPFRELDATFHFDYRFNEDSDLHIVGDLDYVNNLAYNAEAMYKRSQLATGTGPVNNYGLDGSFQSGNQGFLVQLLVGHPKMVERWDWSALLGYRRLETDAVVDAFTDSDFHLGGTNAQGYWVQGNLGFTQNAWFTLRYLSATEVSGSPFAIDVLQLDVNARF